METNDEFDQITKILKVYLNQASNIKITQMFKNLQRSNFFFIYKTYVLKEKEGAKFYLRKTENLLQDVADHLSNNAGIFCRLYEGMALHKNNKDYQTHTQDNDAQRNASGWEITQSQLRLLGIIFLHPLMLSKDR